MKPLSRCYKSGLHLRGVSHVSLDDEHLAPQTLNIVKRMNNSSVSFVLFMGSQPPTPGSPRWQCGPAD
jgi:hypothetical protein